MTSQLKLSKRLTITWITDRAFKDKCRESPDFCLGDTTTWYLKMESDVPIHGQTGKYYTISLMERESRDPKKPFTVITGVDVNSENSNPFRNPCSTVLVKKTKQKIWHQNMEDMTSYVVSFYSYAEMMVVCVFRDVASSACRIKSGKNHLSTQTDMEWSLTSHWPPASKDVACELDNLSGDLSSLLEQQHCADLKLMCKGRLFSVHKSILVARSQFFAQKFQVESVENEPPTIDIPDVDDDILELLLKFAYSGKIPCLNYESAPRLWAAGGTYAVHGLRRACLEWMVRNLSQENCVDFLAISDEFDDDAYKNLVVSFIVSHPDVLKSEKWKKFSEVPSKLAIEVYENFVSSVFDKSNPAD